MWKIIRGPYWWAKGSISPNPWAHSGESIRHGLWKTIVGKGIRFFCLPVASFSQSRFWITKKKKPDMGVPKPNN